jgi:hypothetical protein
LTALAIKFPPPQVAKDPREDAKAPLLATEGFKAPSQFFRFKSPGSRRRQAPLLGRVSRRQRFLLNHKTPFGKEYYVIAKLGSSRLEILKRRGKETGC